jgi:hypothetical protein
MVIWSKGSADLRRGSKGEAVWERGTDGWGASVIDRAEVEAAGVQPPTANFSAHGFEFCLGGREECPLLEGCVLDAAEGKLRVNENAT